MPIPHRRLEGYGSSAAIYASFISAVTGAISLQLIRRHSAIPLGSRTLFTAIEKDGYESPRIANDSPISTPCLTTIQIQLTVVGKLTVALQTVAQHSMSRLQSPKSNPGEIHDAQSGLDVWLSPNGTIARLVSIDASSHNGSTSDLPSSLAAGGEGSSPISALKRLQWKRSVLEWLGNVGLPVNSHEEELWVEVEFWEPFYAKLAGETWRQSEESPSAFPLKRILWPARYCFRRIKSISLDLSYETQDACRLADNPLELAEEWYFTENPTLDEVDFISPSRSQEQASKEPEMSPPKTEFPEPVESLSRIAQYPELQPPNLLYPTPPDGATTVPSDAFAEYTDPPLPQVQQDNGPKHQEQVSFKEQKNIDLTMDFGPSAGLVVGSGLYDTTGEDDLFGEINDKDFGSRGITDADFSFFDEPELEGMVGAQTGGHVQSLPDIANTSLEDVKQQPDLDTPMLDDHVEEPAEQVSATPIDSGDQTAEPPREQEALDAHIPSPGDENNQPISPPLSPVEVKKILFPGSDEGDQSATKRDRKQSHYNPVAFKQNMGNWNQKYGADGRFWFSTGTSAATDSADPASDIPTIGLPRRRSRTRSSVQSPAKAAGDQPLRSTSQSSSASSDDDSDEIISEGIRSPVPMTTRKRKRAQSSSSNSGAQSPEKPLFENAQVTSTTRNENFTFLGNFLSTFSDWSLLGYFWVPQNQLPPMISSKEEQIQVAQLLADQITQSSLDHKLDGSFGLSRLDDEVYPLRNLLDDTTSTGGIDKLDLKGYASLQDDGSSLSASGSLTPRQLPQRKETAKESISRLSSPHLRVRRGKDYLEVLPPTVSFWETFDLEPAHGPKDISAYCIHPQVTTEAADTFIERLGLIYSSCNLGSHVRGDRSMVFERGLGSWDVEASGTSGYVSTMQSLRVLCDELGTLTVQ